MEIWPAGPTPDWRWAQCGEGLPVVWGANRGPQSGWLATSVHIIVSSRSGCSGHSILPVAWLLY